MALAMDAAKSTAPKVFNAYIPKVTSAAPGAVVVHSYSAGRQALAQGKTIQYIGASGPLVFDKYQSAGRAFAYFEYDPSNKSMAVKTVIPGTALEG